MKLGHVTPRLRSFDEAKAREFYVDFLGFKITYEHRFGDNLPLYMQVERDNCILILTEHHGDACPGASLLIDVEDLKSFHAELRSKDYKYSKPDITGTEWNSNEMCISDPFGNRLTFQEFRSTGSSE